MDSPSPLPCADSRLHQVLEASGGGTLVLVGLPRLDEIVTTLGAGLREAVLQAAAERLAQTAGGETGLSAATVLRRGDRLALVCAESGDEAAQRARAWVLALEAPLEVAGQRFSTGGCAGLARIDAGGAHEPQRLLRQADRACHEAMRRGRGSCLLHDDAMTQQALRRLRREDTLHRQPPPAAPELRFDLQADMCTGALTGAVVLPQWPGGGLGEHHDLLETAAEAGRLPEVGALLLQAAGRQIRLWRDQGLDVPGLSVELPAALWRDRALVSMTLDALVDQGLPGGVLTLQMDAAALDGEPGALRATLRSLRATGVRIGLVRFGGERALSLAALGRLPVDELTLDAGVLSRLGHRDGVRLAAALIGMGRALGQRIVAEGVRSEDQLDFLRSRHCDEFQGPLLSRPLDPSTMTQVLMHARIQHRLVMDSHVGEPSTRGTTATGGVRAALTAAAG